MRRHGFTLIEVLVVVGIIGLLAGIVLPSVQASRRQARNVQCGSNMRQLAMGLIAYAGQHNGAFPVNSSQAGQFWYLESALGRYVSAPDRVGRAGLPFPNPDPRTSLAGGVFLCPNDLRDAVRSYSMNLYASGGVSSFVKKRLDGTQPPPGRLFRLSGDGDTSRLLLLVESWPELPAQGPQGIGYATQAFVGLQGLPGARFGGSPGVGWITPPDATPGRFQKRDSQITFYRHDPIEHPVEQPKGQANFAFVDGHVAMLRQGQLIRRAKFSSGVALWSPLDPVLEGAPP